MLLMLNVSPLIAALILAFIPKTNRKLLRSASLAFSIVILNLSIGLIGFFDVTNTQFQFGTDLSLIKFFNVQLTLGIDGLSLLLIVLSTFLTTVCLLLS
jgi:NADH-quinone oxidoreductase subunit M